MKFQPEQRVQLKPEWASLYSRRDSGIITEIDETDGDIGVLFESGDELWLKPKTLEPYRTLEAEITEALIDRPDIVRTLEAQCIDSPLPKWDMCELACDTQTATALEKFIYEFECGGTDEEKSFRSRLREAIFEAKRAGFLAALKAGGWKPE